MAKHILFVNTVFVFTSQNIVLNSLYIYHFQQSPVDDKRIPYLCEAPFCAEGALNKLTCKCSGSGITASTCPKGFTEIVNNHGLCSCERKSNPTCPKGFRFDIKNCDCSISQKPICPAGSSVMPHTALCEGIAKPTCPTNAVLHPLGCQCVMEYIRQCPLGSKLSNNGCQCLGGSTTTIPKCFGSCYLDAISGCRCRERLNLGKNVFLQVTIY